MSGDSAGPHVGGGQGTTPDYCQRFVGETLVNSPEPTLLPTIAVGDEYDVVLTVVGGVSAVAISTPNGILGGILNFSNRLERCIDLGFDYKATVIELNGAIVKVRITPRN